MGQSLKTVPRAPDGNLPAKQVPYHAHKPVSGPDDEKDIARQKNLRIVAVKSCTYMDDHKYGKGNQHDGHECRIEYFKSLVFHMFLCFDDSVKVIIFDVLINFL